MVTMESRRYSTFPANKVNYSAGVREEPWGPMSNWLLKCTEDQLTPVYNILKAQLTQHTVLHADETTLQVLHEEGKNPQSKSYTM